MRSRNHLTPQQSPGKETQIDKKLFHQVGIMQKYIFPQLFVLSFLYWRLWNFISWIIILPCTQHSSHECSKKEKQICVTILFCRTVLVDLRDWIIFKLYMIIHLRAAHLWLSYRRAKPTFLSLSFHEDAQFLEVVCILPVSWMDLLQPLGVKKINLHLYSSGKKVP